MKVLYGKSDQIHQFFENNNALRHTSELYFDHTFNKKIKLEFKNSFSSFKRTFSSNTFELKGNQTNRFSELTLFCPYEKGSIVAGFNSIAE